MYSVPIENQHLSSSSTDANRSSGNGISAADGLLRTEGEGAEQGALETLQRGNLMETKEEPRKHKFKKMARKVTPRVAYDELTPSDLEELIDTSKDYQIYDWFEETKESESEEEESVDIIAQLLESEDSQTGKEEPGERKMNIDTLPDVKLEREGEDEEEKMVAEEANENDPHFFDGKERYIGTDYHYYYYDSNGGFVRESPLTEAVGRQFHDVHPEPPIASPTPIDGYENIGLDRRHRRSGNQRVHPDELYTAASRAIPLCEVMRERREVAEFGEAGYCQTQLNAQLQHLRCQLRRPLSKSRENELIDRHETVMLAHILKVAEVDPEEARRLVARLCSPTDEFFERRKKRFPQHCPVAASPAPAPNAPNIIGPFSIAFNTK